MANTAPKVAPEERQEAPEVIERKAEALAKHIRKSKHLIVFTGAGISTSAGIPDFRGPEGIWTLRAQGRQRTDMVNTLQAVPTPTHMALVELQNRGILKYLVSQNCDGLHRKSGILPVNFRAVATYERTVHDHRTGRECARCGGVLLDSIINFGEYLPAQSLQLAHEHAEKADLCLVLGSSLTVSPANEVPGVVGRRRRAKLAICNLQDTPLDWLTDLRIYSRTDELMIRVMAKLDIPIPSFILRRRLIVRTESAGGGRHQLRVSGVDVDGTPVTFLRSVKLEYNRRVARSEPFIIHFRGDIEPGTQLRLELEFMGHYGEPNLDVWYEYVDGDEGDAQTLYLLEYNPQTGEWRTSKLEALDTDDGMHDVPVRENAGLIPTDDKALSNGVKGANPPEVIVID
ncbi:hypothetical protein AAE478_002217 [Parahypoxylon ruwenzoriense]